MLYPEIFSGGARVAILNNITKNKNTRRINNKFIFDFECYEEKFKTDHIIDTNEIRFDNKYFDIKYIELIQKTDIKYRVQCEHVFYRLIEGGDIVRYANTGTPTAILTDLLSGTDFLVGTVDFVDPIVFAVNRTASKMNIILDLINSLGGEIDFDGFNINLLNSIGQDNGYSIRVGKNLKGLTKIIDKRGVNKLAYKIDLENIFKSDRFKALGLEDLEKVDIGDTVEVVSDAAGVNVKLEVLELSKDVIDDRNLVVILSDTIDLINDDIYNDKIAAVRKDEVLFGVKINNDVGIEIERTDLLARTILNADLFAMQTGDGFGGYINAVYFDPGSGKYIFEGDIDASGTITGAEIIGSSINNGSGTFTVDILGNVIANSLEVNGGDINGGNIDGATITGGTIRTSSSGQRIQISNDDLNTFNNSNQKNGVQLEASSGFNSLDFFENGVLEAVVQFNPSPTNLMSISSLGNRMNISADNDINITTGLGANIDIDASGILDLKGASVTKNGISFDQYDVLAGNGIDVSYSVSGQTVDFDPSEVAGIGLREDGALNLELDLTYTDDRYCVNESSQQMGFQVVGGALEVFINGVFQFTLNP